MDRHARSASRRPLCGESSLQFGSPATTGKSVQKPKLSNDRFLIQDGDVGQFSQAYDVGLICSGNLRHGACMRIGSLEPCTASNQEDMMSEAVAVGYSSSETTRLTLLRRRAILSCAIGNFFELFDFTIYGYFAVAITKAFYPSGSMYGTYAAFGAAFLMRPVGAVIIGAYGDRMGRRAALSLQFG
jgi:hypothetical protein